MHTNSNNFFFFSSSSFFFFFSKFLVMKMPVCLEGCNVPESAALLPMVRVTSVVKSSTVVLTVTQEAH